jgi:hypothetical protein
MVGLARPSVLSAPGAAPVTPTARTPGPAGARPTPGAPARTAQPELAEAIIREELDRLIAAREREPK